FMCRTSVHEFYTLPLHDALPICSPTKAANRSPVATLRESMRASPVTRSSPVAPPTSRPPVISAISRAVVSSMVSVLRRHGWRRCRLRRGQGIAKSETIIERMDDTADLLSGLGPLARQQDGVAHVREASGSHDRLTAPGNLSDLSLRVLRDA